MIMELFEEHASELPPWYTDPPSSLYTDPQEP
ncbi:hypothetical protein CSUI_005067, partial [Cystoisospora suis]